MTLWPQKELINMDISLLFCYSFLMNNIIWCCLAELENKVVCAFKEWTEVLQDKRGEYGLQWTFLKL